MDVHPRGCCPQSSVLLLYRRVCVDKPPGFTLSSTGGGRVISTVLSGEQWLLAEEWAAGNLLQPSLCVRALGCHLHHQHQGSVVVWNK